MEDDEPGGELTRKQRKAEHVAKELNLPAVAANKASLHNKLVVQVCKVTGLEAVGTVGEVCDTSVAVLCGSQTVETKVVYGRHVPYT